MSPRSPSPATFCGGYRVGPLLAEGGMGLLFRAERLVDGRPVVLKCLAPEARAGRRELANEARALTTLDHPSIVGLVEHGEDGNLAFLAMDALDGENLGARLRNGPVPTRLALRWLAELASALDHMHARGVVHRDLKPGNVVLHRGAERTERAVIVDFGLATHAPTSSTARAQFLCGTPAYMAPEQALGLEAQIGPATDRYALAAIALELLTGERPYPRLSVGELLRAVVEQPPRRPSALGNFDATVDAVFARAMAREPERRYETASDLVRALRAVLPRDGETTARVRQRSISAPTLRAKAA